MGIGLDRLFSLVRGIREGTAGGTELRGVMICVIPCYAVLCRVMPEMPT